MVYSLDQADRLTDQVRKLASGYVHHLAGQFANIDFWLDEVIHALDVLDNYGCTPPAN